MSRSRYCWRRTAGSGGHVLASAAPRRDPALPDPTAQGVTRDPARAPRPTSPTSRADGAGAGQLVSTWRRRSAAVVGVAMRAWDHRLAHRCAVAGLLLGYERRW
jgi:hypothetical protein